MQAWKCVRLWTRRYLDS